MFPFPFQSQLITQCRKPRNMPVDEFFLNGVAFITLDKTGNGCAKAPGTVDNGSPPIIFHNWHCS